MEENKYFISFVEEYWPGQLPNTTIGRIEVSGDSRESPHNTEEIPWGTERIDEFRAFRERWDWREILPYHLDWLRKYVRKEYFGRKR